jgi:hypothetical protein
MGRSTVHYADSETNNILKRLHNKLRPAGTPVQRVEYIIELLLLRIFEVKLTQDPEFAQLRGAFKGENEKLLFSEIAGLPNEQILPALNQKFFPFYSRILSEARKVWKGNLSTKVQDQLVLIEEVFSNSNFSNNVTSGNMAEIIGLVAELDKDRLLKTDLLGDAIESALSETGGTKDIGLGMRDIRERKRLKPKEHVLDHMGSTELAANLFRATQTEEKLRRENMRNKDHATRIHNEVGRKVRKTIHELGGTMPENLPVAESIKKVESREKKRLKAGQKNIAGEQSGS